MAALALVYANASGVVEVADQARAQQAAESALGAGATARNAIGQALLLAQGDFDSSVSAAAIDEARVILQELESRIRALAESTPSEALVAAAQNASVQASAVLSLIEDGDVDAAGLAASGPTTQAFEDVSRELTSIRGAAADAIAQAAAKASSVATASRFAVAFFVPTIAVGLSLVLVRRRRKREQLAADLERERTINRSKDQLIANLSHELRTPLTGIYTSALTIEDTGFEDLEVARELNSMIVDQSADLNRMVEDLLVSAQADAGRLSFDLRPTDPVAEIESVVKELSRLGTPIRVQAETSLVVADGGRLRQLLRNLISNAVRHGGSTVEVFGAPTRSGYVIRVEDDGPGVPEEIERRLFERFVHQGDRPLIVGSVGLGLAITRVLAEHMGGRIEYRRDSGRTIFEVHLRRAIDDGAAMPPAPWAAPDALIDDDQSAVPDEVSRIHR
jgi:two-component system OmpR family sensor kinase